MEMLRILQLQTVLIFATLVAGVVLKYVSFTEGRELHRSIALLAGLVGVITLGYLLFKRARPLVIFLEIVAVAAIFLAAYGGKITATNYNMGFALMVSSGIVALGSSMVALAKAKNFDY